MAMSIGGDPCDHCRSFVQRADAWATHYGGYDPDAWERLVAPHPHWAEAGRAPLLCLACRCCWELSENPDCGYAHYGAITYHEYLRQRTPVTDTHSPDERRWRHVFVALVSFAVLLAFAGAMMGVIAKLGSGQEFTAADARFMAVLAPCAGLASAALFVVWRRRQA